MPYILRVYIPLVIVKNFCRRFKEQKYFYAKYYDNRFATEKKNTNYGTCIAMCDNCSDVYAVWPFAHWCVAPSFPKALDVFNCTLYWNPSESWLYSYERGGSKQVSDWLCRLPHTQTEEYSYGETWQHILR